jgi:hypothetical protein
MYPKEIYGCELIFLAQNREQQRAFVNTAMNLRVPYKVSDLLVI